MPLSATDAARLREHLATILVRDLGVAVNDLPRDAARSLDAAIGGVLRAVPSANLDELVERLDYDARRETDLDYAGTITVRAHLRHDVDFGNEMEGEHDSHYVGIEDVDLVDLQLREGWKDLAVWTARDGLLAEGDHDLISDAQKFIGALETKQDQLDDEAAEAAAQRPFAIILASPYDSAS